MLMAVFLLYSCHKNISRQWELSCQRLMALMRELLGNVLVRLQNSTGFEGMCRDAGEEMEEEEETGWTSPGIG